MNDGTQPYDQQDDEPGLWFDRFERFRLAGPGRSLLAVYNAERAARDEDPAKDIPGAWKEASETWRWRERAAVWDAAEQQRRREQYDKEREEDHEARVLLLKAARGKLVRRLQSLSPDTIRPDVLFQGIKMVVEQLRAEYDDLPTQPIDVSSLSDEELQAIIAPGPRTR